MRHRRNTVLCMSAVLSIFSMHLLSAEPYVDQFGVTETEAINDGFVFINGRYIEAPYRVTRRGLKLFINGNMISLPSRHMESPVMEGYDNPDALSAAQRQKLFRSLEATRGIYEKKLARGYGYLFSDQGGHVTLSPYVVAYDLPEVIQLLTSRKTKNDKLAELKPHNWHLYINIEPLVDNFSPSAQLSARLEHKAEELLRADDFGTREDSVDSGFVFFNGDYLEAPYRLERRGLGVFINQRMIVRPPEWPLREYDGNTDPKLPSEITSESSINDEIVNEYLHGKFAYLRKHSTMEEERSIMEEVFRGLPLVVKADIDKDRPYILHITTTEGLTISQSLISMRGRGTDMDKAGVLQRVERQFKHFQAALTGGACYLLSSKGGTTRLSAASISSKLVPAIDILRRRETPQRKIEALRECGVNISEEGLREMVDNFRESAQLVTRLKELRNPR